MNYQRKNIGRGRSEFRRKIRVKRVKIFHIDEKIFGIVEKAFSVREDIVTGLEVTDEFFEFLEDGVVGDGVIGFTATAVVP
jgi:glycerol-3-phosphate responsive antiterminator